MNNFQRNGAKSNADVGSNFEYIAKAYFENQNILLSSPFVLNIGHSNKKPHKFDLGSQDKKIIIECKAHTWTKTDNIPSAKLTTWDQAMYYFSLAPLEYKKVLFVEKYFSHKRNLTLGQYYIDHHSHLIPKNVSILEYDCHNNACHDLKTYHKDGH